MDNKWTVINDRITVKFKMKTPITTFNGNSEILLTNTPTVPAAAVPTATPVNPIFINEEISRAVGTTRHP